MRPPTPHPKLLYFAERHPHFSPAEFKERWRRHGALGMSLPRWRNILRYAQCDPVVCPLAGLAPLECDGVAMVWYRSEATRQAHVADRSGSVTKADESETFARPVARFALLTDEIVFLSGEAGRLKLFMAVHRTAALSRAEFHDLWSGVFGPRLAAAIGMTDPHGGYIQNHARPAAEGATGFEADCIDEISVKDPAAFLDRLRAELARAPLAASVRVLVTEEMVLYQAQD
jgi:hypothetical protein